MAAYTWDAKAARYKDAAGRFVPKAAVLAAADQAIAGAKLEIEAQCSRLQSGGASLADWQTGMAAIIRSLHCGLAAAGKGGWASMGPADWGRVGLITRNQYQYLARFAAQIQAGEIDIQSGALAYRARLYADAGRQTFEQAARLAAQDAPTLQTERNVLGEADHCEDCLAATAAGSVPIGTLTPPGARQCRMFCRCHLEYR